MNNQIKLLSSSMSRLVTKKIGVWPNKKVTKPDQMLWPNLTKCVLLWSQIWPNIWSKHRKQQKSFIFVIYNRIIEINSFYIIIIHQMNFHLPMIFEQKIKQRMKTHLMKYDEVR